MLQLQWLLNAAEPLVPPLDLAAIVLTRLLQIRCQKEGLQTLLLVAGSVAVSGWTRDCKLALMGGILRDHLGKRVCL